MVDKTKQGKEVTASAIATIEAAEFGRLYAENVKTGESLFHRAVFTLSPLGKGARLTWIEDANKVANATGKAIGDAYAKQILAAAAFHADLPAQQRDAFLKLPVESMRGAKKAQADKRLTYDPAQDAFVVAAKDAKAKPGAQTAPKAEADTGSKGAAPDELEKLMASLQAKCRVPGDGTTLYGILKLIDEDPLRAVEVWKFGWTTYKLATGNGKTQ